jgi:hypothetical protein
MLKSAIEDNSVRAVVIMECGTNERNGFEFRAEAYDFINHPNWDTINLNLTSPQSGEVTGKLNLERQLQLSLRYYLVSEPS